jgi:hypothetical protein
MTLRRIFWSAVWLSLGLTSALCFSCQDASVSCLSDRQCDVESTCVSGQCVGAELIDQDPFKYYTEEMHYRLVSDCGICHAAAVESEPAPTPSGMMEDENKDPYKLPIYSTDLGDSGWRIYIDDLNEQRLLVSYLDTMQYINLNAPEESLLFAFGRGEVGISQFARHPKLYTTRDELAVMGEMGEDDGVDEDISDQNMILYQTAPIGYERLVNWARLPHGNPQIIRYNLAAYLDGPQTQVAQFCGGCHNGDPILLDESVLPSGGFAFQKDPVDEADLAPLTGLINLSDPKGSSLIRLLVGEFDHPAIIEEARLLPLEEVVIPWIESLQP